MPDAIVLLPIAKPAAKTEKLATNANQLQENPAPTNQNANAVLIITKIPIPNSANSAIRTITTDVSNVKPLETINV